MAAAKESGSNVVTEEQPKAYELVPATEPAVDENPTLDEDATPAGVERAKTKGNQHFSKNENDVAIAWFSKGLWLVQHKKVDCDIKQYSFLFSNRSIAWIKKEEWTKAESDATNALLVNDSNQKALYRRARARIELQRFEDAKADVDLLFSQFMQNSKTDAMQNDVVRLRQRIDEILRDPSFTYVPLIEETEDNPLEMVSTYNDKDECNWMPKKVLPKNFVFNAEGGPKACEFEPIADPQPPACRQLDVKELTHLEASKPYAHPPGEGQKMPSIPPPDLKPVEKNDDDSDDDGVTSANDVKKVMEMMQKKQATQGKIEVLEAEVDPTDPHPELDVKMTPEGVTVGKVNGQNAFQQGDLTLAESWWTKSLWVSEKMGIEQTNSGTTALLHSNIASVFMKQEKYDQAVESATLSLKFKETFNGYLRRAEARYELGIDEMALDDAKKAVEINGGSGLVQNASDLIKKIEERMAGGKKDDCDNGSKAQG